MTKQSSLKYYFLISLVYITILFGLNYTANAQKKTIISCDQMVDIINSLRINSIIKTPDFQNEDINKDTFFLMYQWIDDLKLYISQDDLDNSLAEIIKKNAISLYNNDCTLIDKFADFFRKRFDELHPVILKLIHKKHNYKIQEHILLEGLEIEFAQNYQALIQRWDKFIKFEKLVFSHSLSDEQISSKLVKTYQIIKQVINSDNFFKFLWLKTVTKFIDPFSKLNITHPTHKSFYFNLNSSPFFKVPSHSDLELKKQTYYIKTRSELVPRNLYDMMLFNRRAYPKIKSLKLVPRKSRILGYTDPSTHPLKKSIFGQQAREFNKFNHNSFLPLTMLEFNLNQLYYRVIPPISKTNFISSNPLISYNIFQFISNKKTNNHSEKDLSTNQANNNNITYDNSSSSIKKARIKVVSARSLVPFNKFSAQNYIEEKFSSIMQKISNIANLKSDVVLLDFRNSREYYDDNYYSLNKFASFFLKTNSPFIRKILKNGQQDILYTLDQQDKISTDKPLVILYNSFTSKTFYIMINAFKQQNRALIINSDFKKDYINLSETLIPQVNNIKITPMKEHSGSISFTEGFILDFFGSFLKKDHSIADFFLGDFTKKIMISKIFGSQPYHRNLDYPNNILNEKILAKYEKVVNKPINFFDYKMVNDNIINMLKKRSAQRLQNINSTMNDQKLKNHNLCQDNKICISLHKADYVSQIKQGLKKYENFLRIIDNLKNDYNQFINEDFSKFTFQGIELIENDYALYETLKIAADYYYLLKVSSDINFDWDKLTYY